MVCVPTTNWRERADAEERRQKRLLDLISVSARKRAAALEDGVRDLGTISAVARDRGVSPSAVRKSIREHGTGTLPPAGGSPTKTE